MGETPEQRTSRLTREVCGVLERRTPEQRAATVARMDMRASELLGLPLEPETVKWMEEQ